MTKQALIERITAHFPQALRALDQWVMWRLEQRQGEKKPTKVPYSAATGNKAESDNPLTWASFHAACGAFLNGSYNGVGFMFSEHDPYVGIDFDGCVAGEHIDPQALRWMRSLDSYTEFSQSGTGIHTIVVGKLPGGGRKSAKHGVEMYDNRRFFVVTGDHVAGTPADVQERQAALTALHDEIFPTKAEPQPRPQNATPAAIPADDEALIQRMFAARNGTDVAALWAGNLSAYNNDESAGDLALCNHLAFWTGNDAERMDRLFRQSALMRDKWDRNARHGETYGQGTIARAIATTMAAYTGQRQNGSNGHSNGHSNGYHANGNGQAASTHAPTGDKAPQAKQINVFDALNDIAQSGNEDRRSLVEAIAADVGAVDPSQHGRLLKAVLLADPSYTKTEAKEFIKACVAKAKKLAKKQAAADLLQRKAEQKQAAMAARSEHTIVVGDRQLRDVTYEALDALVDMVKANPQYPPLYIKVGALSRVVCDERGIYSSQEIKTPAMPGLLSDAADWITIIDNEKTYKEINVFPPKDVAADVLSLADWPGIPPLGSIVNAPVFGKDGTLHSDPGYNELTQLYYTGGVTVGDTTPTPERVEWAKHMLMTEMMGNFPFKDEASRAHALSYLLSPFVREMINGPVPPTVFDAPTEGTGKSLLVNSCTYIFLGHDAPTMSDTQDDEEWRKRITSQLLSGATHALIDNINREVDSGVLANAWTQPIWDDRTLGVNRNVKIPNRMIWTLSANNIQMSRENTRRVVWCGLDANMERPSTRNTEEFRHPDLRSWLAENRDHLVTAVLILIRAWLAAGRPKFNGRAKGSYESWSYVMGGILQTIGVEGFLGNEDALFAHAVTDADEMGEFIQAWWDLYGNGEAGLSRLFKLASVSDDDNENKLGDYLNLLGAKLSSGKMRGRQQQLGRLLDSTKGRVYRGFKIAYVRLLRGEKMYRLEDHRAEEDANQAF